MKERIKERTRQKIRIAIVLFIVIFSILYVSHMDYEDQQLQISIPNAR